MRARAYHGTRDVTARSAAARPSSCACRRRTTGRSRWTEGPPDDRFVYLSDVLPTAWQAVEYADVPEGETLLVLGLGPIGEMATRVAQ
jgi:threonine dehydrogenase-like Zn-dependent dehydrogenase